MAETRVNLRHLLEDLRDAYPIPAEEVIITELVANALDSGARAIRFIVAPAGRTLTLIDDGRGMNPADLVRYHDIAASTKVRGKGIGFAGVGVKLALLMADAVVTETRRGRHHSATRWSLETPQRAPWRKIKSDGLIEGKSGTAVTIVLTDGGCPLLRPEFISVTLSRHFLALLDPSLRARVLDTLYHGSVSFTVNGLAVAPAVHPDAGRREFAVRLGTRGRLAGVGWLRIANEPLREEERGIAVSTYGKVIKRGWEWLGLTPRRPDRLTGMLEAPMLAAMLTINKADFLRDGPSLWKFYRFRRAVQKALEPLLAELGEQDEPIRVDRPLKESVRDLQRALSNLALEFPGLAALVGTRGKGLLASEEANPNATEGPMAPTGAVAPGDLVPDPSPEPEPSPETVRMGAEDEPLADHRAAGSPRAAGLVVEYEDRPDREEPAWIAGGSLRINRAHPAFHRAVQERAEAYHLAVATAWAVAQVLDESADRQRFVNRFLRIWGQSE